MQLSFRKILCAGSLALAFVTGTASAAVPDKKAITDLVKRVLKEHAVHFETSFIPQEKGKDVFELESKNGMILLKGSNGLSIASALNYYLQNYAHCDISWNGTNLNLPSPLPVVKEKVHKTTPYQYRYYLNYCTFNYTMSWWNWDRWQWEIDWMALNGVNMPLAITGQNSVWDRVYKGLGLTDKDLSNFFSGPCYFNWFWMGNIDGWGGPLPQSFMKGHEELQKKILERERSLGMTPVLPAFTGHVPSAFKDKFPNAKVKKTNWDAGFDDVYILDPGDSMFTLIGKRFMEEEIRTFGTDHLYSSDTFNENLPPTNDSLYLHNISKKIYQSMAAADTAAVWVMQGWMFHYQSEFWHPAQIKALFTAAPDDKMIVLDLYSENSPQWIKTDGYYGKQWIWCMLLNFGGNISMYGRMNNVANDPANALHNPAARNMIGIGLTPEGIEQNPVMYALMLENVWRDQPINLDTWLKDYTLRRYGKQNPDADLAWDVLRKTVYNGGLTEGGPESILTGRPTFNTSTTRTKTQLDYAPGEMLAAWDHLQKAADVLKNSDGFRYDIVDVTRQVLANYADSLQQQVAKAYKSNDSVSFKKYSQQFLTLLDDMDRLLATRKDFLLGRWLSDAKSWGTNPAEKTLYERNARDLITLWGDKNSPLHEYSSRQWAGLLKNFYRARWQQYFAYVDSCMRQKKPVDDTYFDDQIKNWEWKWVNAKELYPVTTQGDAIVLSKELYAKYKAIVHQTYK
ncbi:alpha-N-acetylglucosaminidase [Chitinophaga sp. YR573]|uniref:alpha-N-acetylglucosaminidase n=1 Tax=Chitinophaga sp. YR573 TaxID=1881040 RepID=UPI0008BD99DF|nr:alpha-N-acetylglucosaminidase [Chitinophaga sp. YR573]SEW40478.1 alpha-N-acetylglucosaminidase [Chitinophaga sp. YR573]